MEQFTELLSPILANLLLTMVGAAITAVGTWLSMFIKSKLNASQLELLDNLAANAVLAVEQSTYGTELANAAVAKKSAAMDMLSVFLKKYGITITPEQMDATIEAAVANVLNANKLVEPPKLVEVEGPGDPNNPFM